MRTVLLLLAALLVADRLAAQTADVAAETNARVARAFGAARDVERAEDVEVLRRILNRGLGLPDKVTAYPYSWAPYVSGTSAAVNPVQAPSVTMFQYDPSAAAREVDLHNHPAVVSRILAGGPADVTAPRVSAAIGPFDGVYLPGHGVVFTLRVPETVSVTLDPPAKANYLAETCRKCHSTEPVSHSVLEPANVTPVPPSEWERTRRELHGESAAGPPKVVARLTREQVCDPGTLANQIIAKLHGNAGRVRHLAAGEHVTVVVTFDGHAGSPRVRQNLQVGPGGLVEVTSAVSTPPSGKPGFNPDEVKSLTLGDLHLKQGKAKEAAFAYEVGLARYKEAVYRATPPAQTTAAQRADLTRELQKGVRDAFAKLAQAYLAAGEVEKAQAALDQARTFKAELAAADGSPAGVPVPAKLIVTVPVAELAKVEGDPAAFRKTVKIETVGFPPADRTAKPKQ